MDNPVLIENIDDAIAKCKSLATEFNIWIGPVRLPGQKGYYLRSSSALLCIDGKWRKEGSGWSITEFSENQEGILIEFPALISTV